MNDEVPAALLVAIVGLVLTAFCANGIRRELRAPPGRPTGWPLVAFACVGLLAGLAMAGAGVLYLEVATHSTDL